MQGRKLWASPAELLSVHRPQMLSPSLLGVPAQLSIFPLTALTFAVGVRELELDGKAWYKVLALVPRPPKRCWQPFSSISKPHSISDILSSW